MILSRITDGKKISNGVKYVKGEIGVMVRDCHIEAELEEGIYCVYAEVDWINGRSMTDFGYTITRYGEGSDPFIFNNESREGFLELAFLSAQSQNLGIITERNLSSKGAPKISVSDCNDSSSYFY